MGLSWSQRAEKANGLPNLGLGGTLVAATATSYFAAKAAGVLTIIIIRGWNVYVAGLRVTDWKHGVMSNGQPLPFPGTFVLGLITFVLWMLLIGCVEFIAGLVHAGLKDRGRWAATAARLIGGILLLSLAFWFYNTGKFALIHPVPFAPLIAGMVLIWKGVATAFRRGNQKDIA